MKVTGKLIIALKVFYYFFKNIPVHYGIYLRTTNLFQFPKILSDISCIENCSCEKSKIDDS